MHIGSSICIAILGLFLIPFGSYLVWSNEANNVCTSAAYSDAEEVIKEDDVPTTIATQSILSDDFVEGCDPTGKRGKFVHLECPVDDSLETKDASTGIFVDGAYKLMLTSEQFSYVESSNTEENGNGNGSRTCYCYGLKWTQKVATQIRSNSICQSCPVPTDTIIPRIPGGPAPANGLGSFTRYAPSISLGNGAFIIGGKYIPNIAKKKRVEVPGLPENTIKGSFNYTDSDLCDAHDGELTGCWYSTEFRQSVNDQCSSSSTSSPCPGDTRITVTAYGSHYLSIIGKESFSKNPPIQLLSEAFGGSAFPPCSEKSLFYISSGMKSAEVLFSELNTSLEMLTQIVRLASFAVICAGIFMTFFPIDAIVEIIPFIGKYVSPMLDWALGIFAVIAGTALWLFTFSLAYIFYRPIIGVPLLIVSLGFFIFALKLQRENKKYVKDVDYESIPSTTVKVLKNYL